MDKEVKLQKWLEEETTEGQQIQKLKVALGEARAVEKDLIHRLSKAQELLELALAVRRPKTPPKIRTRSRVKREGAPGFLVSDTHFGEVVDENRVSGLNSYNKNIAQQRMTKLARSMSWLINWWSTEWSVSEGFVWLGGDLFSGGIHQELAETNDMGPNESLIFGQRILIQLFDHILETTELKKLKVPCVGGNHDRRTYKLHIKNQNEHSAAWVLYQSLADHYRFEKRIEFYIPNGTVIEQFEVLGWKFRFAHGYQVRYRDGVGGLTIPFNKMIQKWDKTKKADYTCIGHHHTYYVLPGGVVNGSTKGYDEYAYDNGLGFEPPRQAAFLVDRERGMIMNTPIWVD